MSTVKNPDTLYKTSDLYFAAYLKTAGVEMKRPEKDRNNERRTLFVFEHRGDGSIQRLQDEYFAGTSKVGALAYADAIKSLKSLVHL